MTDLKDFFAGKALQGILSNQEMFMKLCMDHQTFTRDIKNDGVHDYLAQVCYDISDSMLKERGKREVKRPSPVVKDILDPKTTTSKQKGWYTDMSGTHYRDEDGVEQGKLQELITAKQYFYPVSTTGARTRSCKLLNNGTMIGSAACITCIHNQYFSASKNIQEDMSSRKYILCEQLDKAL